MPSAAKARAIAAAVSARAAIDALLLELTADEVPPDEASDTGTMDDDGRPVCAHQNKTALGTFGAVEHWVCDDCGLEYRR